MVFEKILPLKFSSPVFKTELLCLPSGVAMRMSEGCWVSRLQGACVSKGSGASVEASILSDLIFVVLSLLS